MKKLKLSIIGTGTHDNAYRANYRLGETHKEGDVIIASIPTDEKGKPKVREVEVTILEKGVDLP